MDKTTTLPTANLSDTRMDDFWSNIDPGLTQPKPGSRDLDVGVSDLARATGAGGLELVGGIGELARQAANYGRTQGGKDQGDYLESARANMAAKLAPALDVVAGVGGLAQSGADSLIDGMSADAKEAMSRSLVTETPQGSLELGDGIGDIDVWAMKMAQGVGSLLPTLLGGSVTGIAAKATVGRMVTASMLKRGVSQEVAEAVAAKTVSRLATGAATTTGVTGSVGSAGVNAFDSVQAMSFDELSNSTTFRDAFHRIDGDLQLAHLSDSDKLAMAREETANLASQATMGDAKTWGAAAVGTLMGDTMLFKMLAGKGAGSGVLKGIAKGAVGEGVSEALEEGAQQYIVNEALNEVAGTNINPMKGVVSAAIENGLIGIGVGGSTGGVSGLRGKHAQPAVGGREQAPMQEVPAHEQAEPVASAPDEATTDPLSQPVQGSPLGPSSSQFDELRDVPAYLRQDDTADRFNGLAEDSEVQRALAGEFGPSVQELVAAQMQGGDQGKSLYERVQSGDLGIDPFTGNEDVMQAVEGEQLPSELSQDQETVASPGEEVREVGYELERGDVSAGVETDSIFGPLQTLRITRKGKPFATEKEAAMASRNGQETPVPLNGGGWGVAAIEEVELAKGRIADLNKEQSYEQVAGVDPVSSEGQGDQQPAGEAVSALAGTEPGTPSELSAPDRERGPAPDAVRDEGVHDDSALTTPAEAGVDVSGPVTAAESEPASAKQIRMSQQREGLSVDEATKVVDDFLKDYNGNIPLEPFIREKASEIYGPSIEGTEFARTTKGAYHPSSDRIAIVSGNARPRDGRGADVSSSAPVRDVLVQQPDNLRAGLSSAALSPQSDVDGRGGAGRAGQEADGEVSRAGRGASRAGAKADLLDTLRHEVLGHYGTDTFTPENKRALLQKLIDAKQQPWLAKEWARANQGYKHLDEIGRAEEVFASIAEKALPPRSIQAWGDIKTEFSRLLRKTGLAKGPIKEHELDSLIRAVGKGIRTGERTKQNIRGDHEVIGTPADEPASPGKPERIIRFSKQAQIKGEQPPAKLLTRKEAEMVTRGWLKQYRGVDGIDIQIHATQAEMEKALGLPPVDGLIRRAAFDRSESGLHVAANTITNPRHLREILRHEVLAHYGLANVLGGSHYTSLISKVISSQGNASMKGVWEWVQTHYGDEPAAVQAEEVIAHLAELEPSAWRRGWDKVVSWVTQALRAVGFAPEGITAAEIRSMIEALGNKLQRNDYDEGAVSDKRFSQEGEQLRNAGEKQNPSGTTQGLQLPKRGSPERVSNPNVLSRRDLAKDADKIRDRVAAAGPVSPARSEHESARDDGSLPPDGLKFSQAVAADEALQKLNLGRKPDIIDRTQERLSALRGTDRTAVKSWVDRFIKKANTEMLDALAPIKYAEDSAGITDARESGYIAARMASGAASTMQATMLYGLPEWKDGVIQRKASTGESDALLGIFEGLGKDLHNWLGWMAGHRAEILMAEGRENLLTEQDIAALKSLDKGKESQFQEAKRKWNTLNASVLDLAEEAGLFSADDRAKWESEWYIPFFREGDDGDAMAPFKARGVANQSAGIKKLKGGTANTNDLLENIFTSTSKLIDASMKNMAAQKTVWNLADTGIIEVVARPNMMDWRALKNGKDLITVKLEGEDYMIRVEDPELYRAMTFFDRQPHGKLVRMAASAKRLLTAGVTASPEFMLRNFLRDSLSAWAISKDGFKPMIDSIRGIRKTMKMGGSTIDVMFSGASFLGGHLNGNDPQAMADSVRKALHRKGMTPPQIDRYERSIIRNATHAQEVLGKAWDQYSKYGEALENANREAVYDAAIKAGKSHAQAAFEARDLMDFSMLGASRTMQTMVMLLPFFNARVQGLGKLGRELRDNPRGIAKRAGMITAASLALLALNWDDERYESLPDWDKDGHWHFWFGDEHWRIPKPFEVGILFGTIPERMARAMGDKDTGAQFGKAMARAFMETFEFNPIPQIAMPMTEAYINYDFFRGGAIENSAEQSVLPEARYSEHTSLLMRELGQLTGLSPKKLEHIVVGYTGTIGGYVLAAADGLIRAAQPGESASWRADEIPLVKAVYRGGGPAKSTQHMEQFYEMLGEVNELKRTVDQYRKAGMTKEAQALLDEQGGILKARKALTQTQLQVRQLRNRLDLIQRDKTLSGEEKRRRIDELLTRRNDLVYQAVNKNKANWE